MAGWKIALTALGVALGGASARAESSARPLGLERALEGVPTRVRGADVAVVMAVHDLRDQHARGRRRWDRMRGVDLVDRLLKEGGARDLIGFDGLGAAAAVMAAAAPDGEPVPASLALGVGEDAPWLMLSVAATEGALERWVETQPIEGLKFVSNEQGGITAETGVAPVHGILDGGWLRFWIGAPQPGIEQTGLGFGVLMAPYLEGAQVLFTYDGSGLLGDRLRAEAEDEAERALAAIRQVTIAGGFRDEKTQWAKVVVDHPRLAVMAPFLSDGTDRPGASDLWGPHVQAVFDLALPPGWLQTGLLAVPGLPEALRPVVQSMDGRFSFAAYGGLTDWGVAVGFASAEAARDAVPALAQGLEALTEEVPAVRQVWKGSEAGQLTFRSAPELTGIEVSASKDRVVLLSQAGRSPRPGGSEVRTPGLVRLLSGSHLASGYMLWGAESPELAAYEWMAAALHWFPEITEEIPPPIRPWWDRIVPGLPRLLTLARIQTMFLYDMAMAVDVKGSLLVLELAASEV